MNTIIIRLMKQKSILFGNRQKFREKNVFEAKKIG
jgi:hypothetical protein